VAAKSLLDSSSLKAPRSRSENSHTGSCGGVRFISWNIGAMALRIVGSLAMRRRERFTALFAMYSAWRASRCAVAAASSALVSSWNSASMTVRIAIAPMTMTSAMPASFLRFFARALARADDGGFPVGFVIGGYRS